MLVGSAYLRFGEGPDAPSESISVHKEGEYIFADVSLETARRFGVRTKQGVQYFLRGTDKSGTLTTLCRKAGPVTITMKEIAPTKIYRR